MLNNEKKYFYVDEAGDMTLFDKQGRIIVGQEGISNYFMVGTAQIADPTIVYNKLSALRNELLQDPYFKDVPSMQPENKKTAISFHAKDDLPEVRREVFKLIKTFNVKVIIAIKRKNLLAEYSKELFSSQGQKMKTYDIYDELVSRIFRNLIHKADNHRICFAR
jgi:hypothetical protein